MSKKILIVDDEVLKDGGKFFVTTRESNYEEKEKILLILSGDSEIYVAQTAVMGLDLIEKSHNAITHVICDLSLPGANLHSFLHLDLHKKLDGLAAQYRKGSGESLYDTLLAKMPEIRDFEKDWIQRYLIFDQKAYARFTHAFYGVLVAKRCQELGVPYTVFTKDFSHSAAGCLLLEHAGVVKNASMVEVLVQHFQEERSGSGTKSLFLSEDKTFAIGRKFEQPENWSLLIGRIFS